MKCALDDCVHRVTTHAFMCECCERRARDHGEAGRADRFNLYIYYGGELLASEGSFSMGSITGSTADHQNGPCEGAP